MLNAATWLMNLGVAAGAMLAGRSLVHYFQLESYQFPGYYRTLKRNAARAVLPGCLMTLAAVIAALLHGAAAGSDSWFIQLLLGVLSGAAAAGGRCGTDRGAVRRFLPAAAGGTGRDGAVYHHPFFPGVWGSAPGIAAGYFPRPGTGKGHRAYAE